MMIITIDGPAGAGKSTIAKLLARHLSGMLHTTFEYLDTGSMYRAVTLLGIRSNVDWNVPEQLERLAESADIQVVNGRTLLNGDDITQTVRSPNTTEYTRFAADNPVIRQRMAELQRNTAKALFAAGKSLVTEGRDQGTAVFPNADYKFFLTATPEERTRRRLGELAQRGIIGDFDEIYRNIMDRDARDSARRVGPLCEPPDSIRIVSDGMPVDDVIARLLSEISIVNSGNLPGAGQTYKSGA